MIRKINQQLKNNLLNKTVKKTEPTVQILIVKTISYMLHRPFSCNLLNRTH